MMLSLVRSSYRLIGELCSKRTASGSIASRSASTTTITSARLEISHLLDVIKGNATFLKVPNFLEAPVCNFASQKLLTEYRIEEYSNAKGVKKVSGVGMPYFETTEGQDKKEQYYAIAARSVELTRELFSPYASPMDKLRLEIDERWSKGSSLLDLGNGKMFCGLIRVLQGGALAHEDKLERDHGPIPPHLNYVTQLAANIYLKVPQKGGELCSWRQSMSDAEYDKMRGQSYGISPDRLSRPEEIRPEMGDLIIFNARNLHAIKEGLGGERISISTFMLYGGSEQPIYFWS